MSLSLAVNRGFTMVELLVTLVILALVSAVVAPGLEVWLSSRKLAALKMEIRSEFALLPLMANRSGKQIIVDHPNKINMEGDTIHFSQPIIVNANGFCLGGKFELEYNDTSQNFEVLSPFCEVRRVTQSQ